MNSRNDRTVTNSEENINSNTKTESSSEEKNMGMESMNKNRKQRPILIKDLIVYQKW
jgi:hypothetical protein